ncbi:MAG: glutamine amidotransferase [Hyphomicrobiaceae bacterium]
MFDARLTEDAPSGGHRSPARDASTPPKKPVVVVLHQPHSTPGHIGRWLREQGYPLDIRKPRYGDPLPETLEAHAGAVIFGGPMSANDRDDFILAETRWIDVALKEQRPFLGVCLGAQMLARHLGARVGFHHDDHVEIGYLPIRATDEGRRVCAWPERFYQWHREGFELPSGGVLLAEGGPGAAFENQAFRYGPAAVGLQFHAEITFAQVHRWTGMSRHRLVLKGARPRHEHIHGHFHHAPHVHAWLDAFLSRWLEGRLDQAEPASSASAGVPEPR